MTDAGVAIRHYRALADAIRARVADMGVAYEEIEPAARLPDRYFAKLMTRPPMKLMHPYTIFNVLAALGLKMVLVEEMPAAEVVLPRKKSMRASASINKSAIWMTADQVLQRARSGAQARNARLSAAARRRLARRAAKARWRKEMIGALGK